MSYTVHNSENIIFFKTKEFNKPDDNGLIPAGYIDYLLIDELTNLNGDITIKATIESDEPITSLFLVLEGDGPKKELTKLENCNRKKIFNEFTLNIKNYQTLKLTIKGRSEYMEKLKKLTIQITR